MRRKGTHGIFQPCLCYSHHAFWKAQYKNVMQNQAIPGSFGRSIHYMAENFNFSAPLLTELTKSEKICHKARAVLWWGHQTNFFTGIHHDCQEQKVGSMERWVELGKVVPSPGSYQHAKMWSHQRVKPQSPKCAGAPLQQVVKLLCTQTGVMVTAFELLPLRNILWETVFMGAGYHYTRSWKSTDLESLNKYLNPQSPPFSSN